MLPVATENDCLPGVHDDNLPDMVDAIIAYAESKGISRRQIAIRTGITRARVQRILTGDRTVRYEARMSEINKIAKSIGMNPYGTMVSMEISRSIDENPAILTLLPFLSCLMTGLVAGIADELKDASGIEVGVFREVHAQAMQRRLAKMIADQIILHAERCDALSDDMERGICRTAR